MKIYRIWEKGRYNSGGFSEHYDEPTSMIYSSMEIAKQHLPESSSGYGSYRDYYIKEEEIE